MPPRENNMSATRFCTVAGNFTRSLGHQAPDAPKPSIVCAGAGAPRPPGGFGGAATGVLVAGPGSAARFEKDPEAPSANAGIVAVARRIRRQPTHSDRQEAVS